MRNFCFLLVLSRIAASALVDGLTPGNFGWLAQYLLAQLVGWGLAPPQETDFEVMALVAPAGDKGRATLQKLHRRISTPSSGEVSLQCRRRRPLNVPESQAYAASLYIYPAETDWLLAL